MIINTIPVNIFNATNVFTDSNQGSGSDGMYGTSDDNLQLSSTSAAIDSGTNNVNNSTTDLAGNPRKVDITSVADTGEGLAPLIDMGAFEKQNP